jgi:hypothetical protein
MCCGAQVSADGFLGGFFLIGGVLLFFDRAMYVLFSPLFSVPTDRSILQACNGQRPSPYPLPFEIPSKPTSLTTPTDPLPNWPYNNHRTPKNTPLLRATPKAQRDSSFFWRTSPDFDALGSNRFLRRVIWDFHFIRGFLGHDCGLCEECPGCGTVYWHGG